MVMSANGLSAQEPEIFSSPRVTSWLCACLTLWIGTFGGLLSGARLNLQAETRGLALWRVS
jgi:hypothetical protein